MTVPRRRPQPTRSAGSGGGPRWDGGAIQPLRSSTSPSSARRAIRAPHSQSNQTVGPSMPSLQLAAPAVVQIEGVQLGQQGHGRERSAARQRSRGAAWRRSASKPARLIRRQRSSSTVQSCCFTFSHRPRRPALVHAGFVLRDVALVTALSTSVHARDRSMSASAQGTAQRPPLSPRAATGALRRTRPVSNLSDCPAPRWR